MHLLCLYYFFNNITIIVHTNYVQIVIYTYKRISATSTVMNHSGIEVTAKYYLQEDKEAKMKVQDMKIIDENTNN